jgi:hypothetical protein
MPVGYSNRSKMERARLLFRINIAERGKSFPESL